MAACSQIVIDNIDTSVDYKHSHIKCHMVRKLLQAHQQSSNEKGAAKPQFIAGTLGMPFEKQLAMSYARSQTASKYGSGSF